jgi:dTDP-4-amino-4,6-dideoxygalactose transaminase
MMLRSLRPVGNRIAAPEDTDGRAIEALAEGYRVLHLSSGTAALALAICMARKRSGVSSPEVILPAYGCPDLVAAAIHAGARPMLADVGHNSAEYDLEAVSALIGPNTAAIVAVTFLGIRPDFSGLRTLIGDRNIVLIEDSAQWFPRAPTQRFCGDYVVLSFGRGKPVNVLGGGALLVSGTMESPLEPAARGASMDAAKVAIYNSLIHPRVYGIAERMPFLGIGLTKYHPLEEIAGMPRSHRQRLPANVRRYVSRRLDVQAKWREAIARGGKSHIVDLPLTHGVPADYALLRYPILAGSKALRDEIHARLRQAGLGASTMYAQALPDIERVGPLVTVQSDLAHARDFAARLLTLPTHEDVDDATIERTASLLGN